MYSRRNCTHKCIYLNGSTLVQRYITYSIYIYGIALYKINKDEWLNE